MATYTYECPQHGEFDIESSISSHSPVTECLVCGATSRQVLQATALNGVWEGRHESRMWRDSATKVFQSDSRKKRAK